MKRFYCQCGHEIFFHNRFCLGCGRDIGFDPQSKTVWSGELRSNGMFHALLPQSETLQFQTCNHRNTQIGCNWFVTDGHESGQCMSCRTTRTIPDQAYVKNQKRWRELERAKRHVFYTLLNMNVFKANIPLSKLQFDFLEDQRSNPEVELEHVLSGHEDGLITVNVAEADEGFLHTMKEQMQERYRTLLGHFRHEIGHYVWLMWFDEDESHRALFREVFGDESVDYAEALRLYYEQNRNNHWRSQFITPYASSHPHEDWAETWAHYLHIVDTLETAVSYGLSVFEPHENDFEDWFAEWARVSQVMNALNRSMGLPDPYPFVVSNIVQGKLRFIDDQLT